MWFIECLYRFFRILFKYTRDAIILVRYNEWTIAEYFRKQGAKIGENCLFQVRSLGRDPYLIEIGNYVFIASGVVFHTNDGGAWILKEEIPDSSVFGKIVIEDNCIIGTNSHLLPNIRIGRNSIVGVNSVVITDIPPNSIVMGVPARVIGSSLKYKRRCIARWKEQKPPGYKKIEIERDWWAYTEYKENMQKLRRHLTNILDDNQPPKD